MSYYQLRTFVYANYHPFRLSGVAIHCQWEGARCNGDQLVSGIYMEDFGLNGQLPAEIGQLTDLSFLMLQNNNLEGLLPESIGQLVLLDDGFNISGNHMSGPLPESMLNMVGLGRFYFQQRDPQQYQLCTPNQAVRNFLIRVEDKFTDTGVIPDPRSEDLMDCPQSADPIDF